MFQSRIERLAEIIVNYSIQTQPNENVLIEATDIPRELIQAITREVHKVGGNAFINLRDRQVMRDLLMNAPEEQIRLWGEADSRFMSMMHGYVAVRGNSNLYEWSDISTQKMLQYERLYIKPVHIEQRAKHTKWVVVRYPNEAMAQLAETSTEAFTQFFFDVCTMNYEKMNHAMDALVELMNQTDQVRIVGPGTDLRFSMDGMPAIKCAGQLNLPDGEVYSAPVKDSVNGVITFNTPTPYSGFVFEKIQLTFEKGVITKAAANDTSRLWEILRTDEGSSSIGEFAIGMNPFIKKPLKDILFDEKIDGSLHVALGNCYDDAYNGNHSAIHWDMVLIQRPEFGGGEIWFDDRLIRKDGKFVVPELFCLNPEELR